MFFCYYPEMSTGVPAKARTPVRGDASGAAFYDVALRISAQGPTMPTSTYPNQVGILDDVGGSQVRMWWIWNLITSL